jgi:predicted GNAT family acetyltransferase
VPQELSGRGIGSKLARGVFEHLRRRGARVVTKCPFMAAYGARHPEYAAMLDG